MRTAFKWGTARIQQGIYCLPDFILDSVHCVQGVVLSRETINNVLARNNQNGYQREFKRWKFFRAEAPDELWQIDFKGPFTVQVKKYWFASTIISDLSFRRSSLTMSWRRLKQWLCWRSRIGFRRLFFLTVDRSLKNSGKDGAVSMTLRRILLILLIRRTKAKLKGAFKTLTENSLIICASFLNGSKAK